MPSGVLTAAGAAWAEDGFVYLDSEAPVGLMRVATSGGAAPEVVHASEVGEEVLAHALPFPLPGGHGALVSVRRNHEEDLVVAMDLETGALRTLVEGVIGVYSETSHLVYVERDGSLLAAPFDPTAMELTGPATTGRCG